MAIVPLDNLSRVNIAGMQGANVTPTNTTSLMSGVEFSNTLRNAYIIALRAEEDNPPPPYHNQQEQGRWGLCTKNLTISGYQGVDVTWGQTSVNWGTNIFDNMNVPVAFETSNMCPLKNTDFDPSRPYYGGELSGENSNTFLPINSTLDYLNNPDNIVPNPFYYIDPLIQQPGGLLADNIPTGNNQQIKHSYKLFAEEPTKLKGDQYLSGAYNEEIANFISSENGIDSDTYIGQDSSIDMPPNWNYTSWNLIDGNIVKELEDSASAQWDERVRDVYMFNKFPMDYISSNAENTFASTSYDTDTGSYQIMKWGIRYDEQPLNLDLNNQDFSSNWEERKWIGLEGNIVYVVVILKEGVQLSEDTTINVDIDGSAYWFGYGVNEFGVAYMPGNNHIEIEGFGNDVHEVTGVNGWNVDDTGYSSREIENGADPTKNRWVIEGRAFPNSPIDIATIKVDAEEGKYFSKAPYLNYNNNSNENIKLKLNSKEKTNGNITSYVYSLQFVSATTKTISDGIKVNIKYETQAIVEKTLAINKVSFGNPILSVNGETRLIKIFGTAGSSFGLAVNKGLQESFQIGEATTDIGKVIDKINDVSILGSVANSTTENGYGKSIDIIQDVIGSKGVYTFAQDFPNIVVKKTKVNDAGGVTGTRITLDDYTDIKIGDQICSKTISKDQKVTVTALPLSNTVDISKTMTFADDAIVIFKRDQVYSIDIIPDLTSTLGSDIPSTKSYTLIQKIGPALTFKNSIASTVAITHNNSIATSLSAGADLDVFCSSYGSKYNTKKISFSLTLDIVDASKNFSAIKLPTFNNNIQERSSWTNSLHKFNGGTKVNITNISRSALGANTITLGYDVMISRFGSEDVTMELDLDNVITISS